MVRKILILAANPKNTLRLRLDEEVREIYNGMRRASKRDEFILDQVWATRPVDVRRAMLDLKPNIVHFCGHGEGEEGIAFEDETGNTKLVSAEALAGFFKIFADKVECVVLNICYSEIQAETIAQHIGNVLGMKKAIGDKAAIEFAVAFYDALGAGESFEFAYGLACNAIQWAGIPEHLTPTLKTGSTKQAILKATTSQDISELTKKVSPKERDEIRAKRNKILINELSKIDGIQKCSVFQLEDHTDKGYLLHVRFYENKTNAADILSIIRRTIEELFPDIPYWGEMSTEACDAVGFGFTYIDEYNKFFK